MPSPFADPIWRAEEARVVARVRAGDRLAGEQLYRAYAGPLLRLVLRPRLGDPAAAEDALAETFIAAFRALDGFEDRGAGLWPWLARIAVHKAMDVHRARARAARGCERLEAQAPPPPPETPAEALEALDEAELQAARVRAALSGLHARYREALELRFLQGLGREECARRLAVKLGTFDVLLLRAVRAFARAWEPEE
ncbi:MAG TPA: RNA polymerase sigma factor [Myxococcota bacterium]|nr:RNA polymerase sigma factor [Myxococcota bacterium]HRY93400.1 RNA polymerase sigma factor [Myxococcota bacterium]HSA23437.1 RNA polymerase sigma factor [Myxococcota bacterium]